MKFKSLSISALLICFLGLSAQDTSQKVLFTIDNTPYYTDEFVRVYQKNLDLVKDESQKDLNQYLDLFIGYKLKIKKANQLGLQDGVAYKNELKSYRDQLAKNYVTDSKVTEELIQEAYERSKKEVNASHILLLVDENAAPQDTLKGYQRIMDIRKRALQGEDFGILAQTLSEDPSAKENKGNLGYFSVFRMVYPFETAAYKTAEGQVSLPVRTRFGYHLIKVNAIRENRGEVKVAHIMIFSSTADGSPNADSENTINDIYKKLQQGESFEDLARQFSQDQATAAKGGVLNPFASGQLSSEEFEDTAFSLTKEHPISKPIQTQYGWHIVKLIERMPMKSLDFSKQEIETKISRDDRSRLIEESINEKLHKRYQVKRNEKNFQLALKVANNSLYTNEWNLPENLKPYQDVLFSFANKTHTIEDFLIYLYSQQKEGLGIKPLTKLVDQKYQDFVDLSLKEYYNANLENEFPEFASIMEEYRDGLLLFELMEKEIWTKSKNDTIGLTSYFEKNSQKYQWKNRFDVMILSTTKEEVAKKAHKMVKKNKSADDIKEAFNTKEVVNVMITSGIFEENSEALPKNISPTKGISEVLSQNNYFYVVTVNDYIPAGPKLLEECKGRVINDYQQFLEENWVSQLKQEYQVQVDAAVFQAVKKQMTVK
jgi:peptidyl-prolyl cis-trans isomerase SurA